MSTNRSAATGGTVRGADTGLQASRHSATHRAPAAQVRRLRLTARCLDLQPVFTSDLPLKAELFDSRGTLTERWTW